MAFAPAELPGAVFSASATVSEVENGDVVEEFSVATTSPLPTFAVVAFEPSLSEGLETNLETRKMATPANRHSDRYDHPRRVMYYSLPNGKAVENSTISSLLGGLSASVQPPSIMLVPDNCTD